MQATSRLTSVARTQGRNDRSIGSRKHTWLPASTTIYKILLFTIAASAYNCGGNITSAVPGATPEASKAAVPFQSIDKGQYSGFGKPLQIVVQSVSDWKGLWQNHTAPQQEAPPPPGIDFGREIVIGVFLGSRPTGGYVAEIVSIVKDNGMTTVTFKESTPPHGSMVTQSLTQPFHLVRVPKKGIQTVRFRRVP